LTDVLCDLDGVLYRGDTPLPGASKALQRLRSSGIAVTFVTNNSTRAPTQAAQKIHSLTGVDVVEGDIATSSQAAAEMLNEADAPVLVVGEEGVREAVASRGLSIAGPAAPARCVVVGMYWGVTYRDIATAADAIRAGARFVATNNDPTYPVEDGFLPGAGSLVAAIATAAGVSPEIAGKPHSPMRQLLRKRGIGAAWVIGDRIDTDIALAAAEPDWTSILVRSGVTDDGDDVTLADHVVDDFVGAVELILQRSDEA
jgi:HAD superfamily hydrolase (TIGR01450 family)